MCTARLLTISQHALGTGVSVRGGGVCPDGNCLPRRGVSTQEGCVYPEGCLPRGMSAEGVSAQVGVSAEGMWQTPPRTRGREVSAPRGVYSWRGDGIPACTEADAPRGKTDRCKNITFSTSLRTVMNACIWRDLSVLPFHDDASFVLFVGFVFTIDLPVTDPCFLQTLIVLLITVHVPYNTPQLALQTKK